MNDDDKRLEELTRRLNDLEEVVRELSPVRITLEEAHQERVAERKEKKRG